MMAKDYVSCPDVNDRNAFAARIHGDSMTPTYREGDIVIFSPALSAEDGDDCFVRFADGHTTFKRVRFLGDEVRLEPRNRKHTPQIVRASEITDISKAVFKYQKVNEGRESAGGIRKRAATHSRANLKRAFREGWKAGLAAGRVAAH